MGSQRELYLPSESFIPTPLHLFFPMTVKQLFSIIAGILQGDTLAPFLFIIVVDYVLRMSVDTIKYKGFEIKPRQSSRHSAEYLTDTDFADDIVLVSESLVNPSIYFNP